jgi:cyclophilin family peptidyl-prolyl cis-trans isomerase/vancomycin permeability regulator SanA
MSATTDAVRADAIAVLGCRVLADGSPSPALARRVALAAVAFERGVAPLLVACGGRAWPGGHVEALVIDAGLRARGVPASAIVHELCSLSTMENAAFCAELVRRRAPGKPRVLVATCAWHLPRALGAFRRAGLDALPPEGGWMAPAPAPSLALRLRERLSALADAWVGAPPPRVLAALVAALAGLASACRPEEGARAAPVESASAPPSASAPSGVPSGVGERLEALRRAELARRAADVVVADLGHRDLGVRRAAARALARIGGEAVRPTLLHLLADEDTEVVAWAAYGLGESCAGARDDVTSALVATAARFAGAAAEGDERAPSSLGIEHALARAVGRCDAASSEPTLAAWLARPAPWPAAASYALGDVAQARRKLREETVAALLGVAAGDAQRNAEPAALQPLGRAEHLPPSVHARVREVAAARLAAPGPERIFAVRALGRADDAAAPLLTDVVKDGGRFDVAERAEAARALQRFGRHGQRGLADALATLVPADAAVRLARAAGDFPVMLAVLDAMDTVRGARPHLARLAALEAPNDAGAPERRRLSWLRCRAAQLLAERDWRATSLRRCELDAEVTAADPLPGSIAARAAVAAIGVDGAEIRGARWRAWHAYATAGERRARQDALDLIGRHAEIAAGAEVLALALESEESGLCAKAAEVIAKHPQRALRDESAPRPGRKRRTVERERPAGPAAVHPRLEAALLARLAGTGPTADQEALAAVIDAVGALVLDRARSRLEELCRAPERVLREHAARALAGLLGGPDKVRCEPPPEGLPLPAEIDHLAAQPVALRLESDVGALELRLDPAFAPVAVTRIADLARAGFYDGMVVHRVVPGFVSQLGSPTADGYGLPPGTRAMACETSPVSFAALSIGVALAGRDTGTSQIFVTHAPVPHLDGRYAWIGNASGPWHTLVDGDRIQRATVAPPP